MVTAFGREEVVRMSEKAGIDGFLIKPVGQSTLFDSIMQVFGEEEEREQKSDAGRDTGDGALDMIKGARILLTEDNEINQEVAREILEQAGLVVEIANDGSESVEKFIHSTEEGGKPFDAILMDIQMPVMDGMEATGHIRALELKAQSSKLKGREADTLSASDFQLSAGSGRIPIIAMTAHAMAGDREKSLDAGMDDHVTKPIDPDQLFSSLVNWIKPGQREIPEHLIQQKAGKEKKEEDILLMDFPGIHVEKGLKRLGGNKKLYKNILIKFHTEYTDAVQQIKDALDQKDYELAQRLAHTVKGVSGNIGAEDLQKISGELEASIKNGQEDQHEGLLESFGKQLTIVTDSLSAVSTQETGSEETEGKTGTPEELLELLLKLEPHVKKKKPKPSKEVMEEIGGFTWPDEYIKGIADLKRLIGKYKFKDADVVLGEMLKDLKK